ncbi:MAG TPA: dual specificity protein phosphatase family protein [Blastocatellia bacterium]|jgi:tyrosine-protein phosphatase SIW14|nr:dual specificity protein phosphatase family protein [Blastocatellia bacterium]
MRVVRSASYSRNAVTASFIALAALSVSYAAQKSATPKTSIKNFGCVNEKFYRGAQPEGRDYQDLAAMGIKMVIDLQREGDGDEQRLVEAAGMRFVRIPMSDKSWPTTEAADQFLSLSSNPENQPVFIHCRGGRHRTGAMTAIYRITNDGWTADRAFAEMKQYDFEHGYGHGTLKDYVYNYYGRMDHKGVVADSK